MVRPMRFAAKAQTRPAIAAQATKAWPSVTPIRPGNAHSPACGADVGLDRHLERRPDRVQAQEEAIDEQAANESRDERARRAPRRDRVPERIKKPGRRRRPNANNIGRDQPEGVAEHRADQDHKPDRLEICRRLEDDRKGNEQRAADGRTQRREQEHNADHRDEEGTAAHCESLGDIDDARQFGEMRVAGEEVRARVVGGGEDDRVGRGEAVDFRIGRRLRRDVRSSAAQRPTPLKRRSPERPRRPTSPARAIATARIERWSGQPTARSSAAPAPTSHRGGADDPFDPSRRVDHAHQ